MQGSYVHRCLEGCLGWSAQRGGKRGILGRPLRRGFSYGTGSMNLGEESGVCPESGDNGIADSVRN